VRPELIARAQAGDEQAFRQLIGPYQRELQLHCYRIVGSAQDAQDAMQETLLSAWQGLAGFQGRSSVRTWLYRVATNSCLKALRSASRHPPVNWPPPGEHPPEPSRVGEVIWLQPYPDILLEGIAEPDPGPEATYEAHEAISLAFITALQALPPRQRAVLILRDVLGFPTSQVGAILDCTEDSAASALKRARTTMRREFARSPARQPPPHPGSAEERQLVERFTCAYQAGDVQAIVALLTEDISLTMPPHPLQYQGRDLAARYLATTAFRPSRRSRLIPTRANGQPAFGVYVQDPQARVWHAAGLIVLTLTGSKVSAMTGFDTSTLPHFGLPRTLPG
jgi:RNA polymerase sigma-70 factor (ECF subfamily)